MRTEMLPSLDTTVANAGVGPYCYDAMVVYSVAEILGDVEDRLWEAGDILVDLWRESGWVGED